MLRYQLQFSHLLKRQLTAKTVLEPVASLRPLDYLLITILFASRYHIGQLSLIVSPTDEASITMAAFWLQEMGVSAIHRYWSS